MLQVSGCDADTGVPLRACECRRIRIAQRDEFRVLAKCDSWKVILQRDAAAADDGNADVLHGRAAFLAARSGSGKLQAQT